MSVWIDQYPEDFREPPDYPCLASIEHFALTHLPDSDLAIRVKHKIDKFKKEDLNNAGKIWLLVDFGVCWVFFTCVENLNNTAETYLFFLLQCTYSRLHEDKHCQNHAICL